MLTAGTCKKLSIEWCTSADHIPVRLWNRCFPAPLEGKWWYTTLERSALESQFKFYYALIYIDGIQSGIAPLFLMDVPLALMAPDGLSMFFKMLTSVSFALTHQRTLFVGSPCADEGTVGLIDGITLAEVAGELQEQLELFARRLGAQMITWKDFAHHDVPALSELAARKDLFKVVSFPGAAIRTTASDLGEYLKTLQSARRKRLRKKLRKSDQMGELKVSIVKNPDALQLSEIMRLFSQTYERGKTKFERLGPEFFIEIARHDVARFVMLRRPDDGRLVAFCLAFQFGEKVICKFIGLDYSMPKSWFLYFKLWAATTDWALAEGARDIQTGQTGYSAKLEVGSELIPLTNYCKHLNPWLHKLFGALARSVSWSTLDNDLRVYLKAHPEHQHSASV